MARDDAGIEPMKRLNMIWVVEHPDGWECFETYKEARQHSAYYDKGRIVQFKRLDTSEHRRITTREWMAENGDVNGDKK